VKYSPPRPAEILPAAGSPAAEILRVTRNTNSRCREPAAANHWLAVKPRANERRRALRSRE